MNKFFVWGVGFQANTLYELIKDNIVIEAFIDQNPKLIEKTFKGKKVISFQEYLNLKSKLPIIVSSKHNSDILKLLLESNIDDYVIASELPDYFFNINIDHSKTNYYSKQHAKSVAAR